MSRLDEIKARENRATKGPWRRSIGPDWLMVFSEYPARRHHILSGHNADDLRFAAHAREDIPFLLDLVERAVPFVRYASRNTSSTWTECADEWLTDAGYGEGEG